jgi:hypothetical protein
MQRRNFLHSLAASPLLSLSGQTPGEKRASRILLPSLPDATPIVEAVLFGFDSRAFPFQNHVETHLIPGVNPKLVLSHGPEGSHDEVLLYYGSVIRIGDLFHMWYNGNYGREANQVGYERINCCICYATSKDGITWEKPSLGLVEFKGSRNNNIVKLDAPTLWSTFAVLHDPEEPDPQRRFKAAYEAKPNGRIVFCVAFSPDGLHWTPYANNPVGPFLEMAGIAKRNGLYYLSGQPDLRSHHLNPVRRLGTFVSADFVNWSPCSANGLDRATDWRGPSSEDRLHEFEEVHLGAALWNRGNVFLGIYGQWHGHFSGDRRLVTMDLGLALSHDGVSYYEPIPGFRLIPAREQPESPSGFSPALVQGQGMENVGDRTLYWYSLWRGTPGSGVRMVSWPRDRLGMLKPFLGAQARAISCPIHVLNGRAKVYVNASGLSQQSRLKIGLLDAGFRPIRNYSEAAAAVLDKDGFQIPVVWNGENALAASLGPVRLDIQVEGLRPEDASLHAVYAVGD